MEAVAELFWQLNDMIKDTGSFHCSNPSFPMCLFSSPHFSPHGHKMAATVLGMPSSSNSTQTGKDGEDGQKGYFPYTTISFTGE